MTKVAVVGAGVIGLTSAVVLQKKLPWVHITVISERFSPGTTGDGSAGFWEPYLLEDTPTDDVMRWSGRTYNFFVDLWKSPLAGKAGVSLIPTMYLKDVSGPLPAWKDIVLGCTELSTKEIHHLSAVYGKKFESGFQFISFTCEPTKFLPMLMAEFKQRGGVLEEKSVSSLSDIVEDYDVIINCTGLQSRFIVPDLNVHPIRGQVMRAKAPWVFHCVMDDSEKGCYIIPNQETVVLGGTQQKNWSLEVDKKDSDEIFTKCCQVMPNLKSAEIVTQWVGLRPGRNRVRLERETRKLSNGRKIEIVHNYGHGGAGITLSWGCAEDAVNIVSQILQKKTPSARL